MLVGWSGEFGAQATEQVGNVRWLDDCRPNEVIELRHERAYVFGSTQHYAPYEISSFSSRGPSGCGGEFAMKPEISAPGSDIYSVSAGGGYTNMSGTSMAGPHIAGVVALMRASNPNVDVITVKEILMATAIDLGTPGEDNTGAKSTRLGRSHTMRLSPNQLTLRAPARIRRCRNASISTSLIASAVMNVRTADDAMASGVALLM